MILASGDYLSVCWIPGIEEFYNGVLHYAPMPFTADPPTDAAPLVLLSFQPHLGFKEGSETA
jgi:hypothetical protein